MKVCATSGTVHAVRMSHDGKTADLTIHHGDRKAPSKSNPFPEQPQTSHTIAAKHAPHFPVGKKVKVTVSTAEPDADDTNYAASNTIGKGFMAGKSKG